MISVEKISRLLIKNWGNGNIILKNDLEKVHESSVLRLDIQKANSKLNWYPKWNAEESILFTANWYKEYKRGMPVSTLIKADIINYISSS